MPNIAFPGPHRVLNSDTPPAPQGSVNVLWRGDGVNVSGSVPVAGGGGAVASVFGRTGAVVAVAGDYTAAQVTGAVDQGAAYANPPWITSIAWAKVTGAPAPVSQTPWTQDIDGASYSLRNAGLVLGSNVTGQLVGSNIYYEGGGWKKQQDGPGLAIIKAQDVAGSAILTSPTATGATAPNPGVALVFRDDGVIEFSRKVQLGQSIHLPETNQSWNVWDPDGNWRLLTPGYGQIIAGSSIDGNLRIYTSLPGAAGAIATLRPTVLIGPSGVLLDPAGDVTIGAAGRLVMGNAPGERVRLFDEGGINYALGMEVGCMYQQVASGGVFRWYCGTAPDGGVSAKMALTPDWLLLKTRFRSTYGPPHDSYPVAGQWAGAVINYNNASSEGGLIVANTWADNGTVCFMVGGVNGVWPGGFQNLFSVHGMGAIHMPKLPASATGLTSGALWRDAAAGNVLKIVP